MLGDWCVSEVVEGWLVVRVDYCESEMLSERAMAVPRWVSWMPWSDVSCVESGLRIAIVLIALNSAKKIGWQARAPPSNTEAVASAEAPIYFQLISI